MGYGEEDAANLYGFRCSLLHQGSAQPHRGDFPIAFIEPVGEAPQIHNLSTVVEDDQVGWISIPIFVEEVADAVQRWFEEYASSTTVQRNMDRFVRRHPEGLPPHFGGAPVIA